VKNPAYKGKWVHPEIANPEYVEDNEVYVRGEMGAVGFDLWQVKAGTLFDHILVTDSVQEAETQQAAIADRKDEEKAMFELAEASKREAEEADRKKAEEARKAQEADNEDEDDEDDEEDVPATKKKAAHDDEL